MVLPNFLIIGAAKSGTTALYKTIKKHPDIFMTSIKEPGFFLMDERLLRYYQGPGDNREISYIVHRLKNYLALFEGSERFSARGEASVGYLSLSEFAAPKIFSLIPAAKLIAILRHPAERAYSKYQMLVREGREKLSFEQALAAEQSRIKMNWGWGWRYKANGYYHRLLLPFYERFPREQIRVYLYEDWKNTPEKVLRDLFGYLEVDASVVPEIEYANITRLPRFRRFYNFVVGQHLIKKVLKSFIPADFRKQIVASLLEMNWRKPAPLDPEIRAQLVRDYREDILRLQDLIGRDLSHWMVE